MDYLSFFEETDIQDGGDNFRCLYYRQGGDTQLVCRSRYPMLFVLRGTLELCFKYTQRKVETGQLIVVEAEALTQYRPSEGTVVLVYRPPLRLSDLFKQCSQAYEEPCSTCVPILPQLYTWIDRLLTEHIQGKVWLGEPAHEQRRELAHILMTYPHRTLGELYSAFQACVMGDCEKCRQSLLEQAESGVRY